MAPSPTRHLLQPAAVIRDATVNDLDALVRLEERCFDSDRLSRRSFRYMILRSHARLIVDEADGMLRGYALVLFLRGTSLARLYSIATDPDHRGKGIGQTLLMAAEDAAREHGAVSMRLEIRSDNHVAERLYRAAGYRQFGTYADYYEDHADALRMAKSLISHLKPPVMRVPYYEQTLDFTCGPAALIMAMQALDQTLAADRKLEIRLWRESTTIFMTSGLGGCGPYGLALAAYHRGFGVEIFVNDTGALFVDSVRGEDKKEVLRLAQEDFLDQIHKLPIPLHHTPLSVDEMQQHFDAGGIPIVLISSYRMYRQKFPHWVVITGFDERFVYLHDPYVDSLKGKVRLDSINTPILRREFDRMARYGKTSQRATLIVSRRHSGNQVPA
ncbi:MAG TPA: GNAT family N-acetyltransferase/peptidase C39 family protein [Gammaproteobacteria bacterium]|jgi:ribosomal protein S18 acetylase RimI-like enzyme|nr:GNAT family N-acetyltransferase/peptidase C39 family protein [Gammaproteobacteria bacterium]